MATSGFSYGKSAAQWNVLLYLLWLGVGATPLRASRRTLPASLKKIVDKMTRSLQPKFIKLLELKDPNLVNMFYDLRNYIIEIYPDCNELLYHTHALTTVFSISEKLSDAFCMIPIYTNHLNLGFNKGTLLDDEHKLLIGTGNLIRHIPIKTETDYRNSKVEKLINSAVEFALNDMGKSTKSTGKVISKIK